MGEKYALNLAEDGRVLSVTFDKYGPKECPRTESLPEGDITDYKYINGQFVSEPLPKPEPTTPPDTPLTPEETAAEITKLKERISELERNAVNN